MSFLQNHILSVHTIQFSANIIYRRNIKQRINGAFSYQKQIFDVLLVGFFKGCVKVKWRGTCGSGGGGEVQNNN